MRISAYKRGRELQINIYKKGGGLTRGDWLSRTGTRLTPRNLRWKGGRDTLEGGRWSTLISRDRKIKRNCRHKGEDVLGLTEGFIKNLLPGNNFPGEKVGGKKVWGEGEKRGEGRRAEKKTTSETID